MKLFYALRSRAKIAEHRFKETTIYSHKVKRGG